VTFCSKHSLERRGLKGFTLAEVVITVAIVAMVMIAMIECYVASAARAQWCAQSLAAQSLASQGLERARSANWCYQSWSALSGYVGLGSPDEIPCTNFAPTIIVEYTNTLDIPVVGQPVYATNYITVVNVSTNPPVRQIRCDCVWTFAKSSQLFTNTLITLRGPD
jgi:prepilin-type N-terminal cleavage/methylation domain-containing protein